MHDKRESERLFSILHEDAQSWLAKAKQLRMSAAVMWAEFENAAQSGQVHDGVTERMLAFSGASMLLMGFAFENLLKGIILARDPRAKMARVQGGHGIVAMACAVTTLTSDERYLLERIQIYLTWAGRYQLPKFSQQYHEAQGKVAVTTVDPKTMNRLFARLEQFLLTEWEERQNRHSV
jgi:hypothetical protein